MKVPYDVNYIYSFRFPCFFFSKLSSYNSYSNVVFIKYDIKEVRLPSSLFPSQTVPLFKDNHC